MEEQFVETIMDGLEPIALIIKAQFDKPGLHFFTPLNFSQQVAHMRHPAGHKIAPHVHNPVNRQVLYTQEVLLVRKGRMQVDLFTSPRKLLGSHVLESGDVILLCGGRHSFEMLEETSIMCNRQRSIN